MPRTVAATGWLETIRRKVEAGELGMTEEELTAADADRQAAAEHQAILIRDRRLSTLQTRAPDHYLWAAKHRRPQWTAIRESLRQAIEANPHVWALMGTPAGNGKSTGLIYEGARAIVAGRSVRYVASSLDWRKAIKDETGRLLRDYETCDLLLVDELHWLGKLPDWITAEAMGVIDARYMRRSRRQTLGSGTAPIVELVISLPPGLADRFDVHLGAKETSQRRNGR